MKYSTADVITASLLIGCFVASDCAVSSSSAPGPSNKLLRFTFDDGQDHSSSASQEYAVIENVGSLDTVALMRGKTHRSRLDQGRYGRSAVFYGLPDGSDTLLIENADIEMEELVKRGETLSFQAWLKTREGASDSIIFAHGRNWGIALADKEVVITVSYDGETVQQFLSGQVIPSDGKWHHLQVQSIFLVGISTVSVDFGAASTISDIPQPSGENGPFVLGARYEGEMDEVSLSVGDLTETDLFNQNPESCLAQSSTCLEEVVIVPPLAYPVSDHQERHSVPLRFKSVYNPDICTPANPCSLVVALTCWKESNIEGDLVDLLDEGNFVVSLFDNHCADSPLNPRQASFVSQHLFTASPLRNVIVPKQYTIQVIGTPPLKPDDSKKGKMNDSTGGIVSLRGSSSDLQQTQAYTTVLKTRPPLYI